MQTENQMNKSDHGYASMDDQKQRDIAGRVGKTSSGSPRGFAAMDPRKQREIASMGGKAAHESGHAHEFTPDEARQAGRKGGEVVSQDRQHMSEIGRKGAEARNRTTGSPETEPSTTPTDNRPDFKPDFKNESN
jgi:general stress protein YciG